MHFHVASTDRSWAFHSRVLSFEKTCSIWSIGAVGWERQPGAVAADGLAHGLAVMAA